MAVSGDIVEIAEFDKILERWSADCDYDMWYGYGREPADYEYSPKGILGKPEYDVNGKVLLDPSRGGVVLGRRVKLTLWRKQPVVSFEGEEGSFGKLDSETRNRVYRWLLQGIR